MITINEIKELAAENCTCKHQHPDFWDKCPACKLLDAIVKRIDENFADDIGDKETFWKGAGE